jgi:tetratricopeptide (TPR) repeat protein
MAFVDTETTGLAGGTGTYAFLVGVGVFEGETFAIHQFFMRDFHEEPAQLHALGELLDGLEAVVSFNGKSFDMPLLETRFLMARQPPRLHGAPHLDLLPVARRFWKYRLESCALSSLETEVLGVRRARSDVPGWLIPSLYVDYARSGDAREMPRIFYHNAQDILSLVTLTARMCDLLAPPLPGAEEVPGEDLYGLGRLLQELDDLNRAESAYLQAAQTCRVPGVREASMRDLAYLLKRQERREEALPWWQQLVETDGAVYACEELAKHYEWQDEDLREAITWTRRGIALVEAWPPGHKRRDALADLAHRLERLERKSSLRESPDSEPSVT